MNRGAQVARVKFSKHGAKAALARDLAKALEAKPDPPRVTRLLNGTRRPNPAERAYFEDAHGIGWRLWDQKPERRPRRERAAA